jgi:hypothetical protein
MVKSVYYDESCQKNTQRSFELSRLLVDVELTRPLSGMLERQDALRIIHPM